MGQAMNLVDTHNRVPPWSPAATQPYEQLMEETARRGLHGVAICDHYDPNSKTDDESAWKFDPQAYMDAFYSKRRMPSKRKPGDPPGFLLGIELDWIPEKKQILHQVFNDHPFDLGIISMHFLRGHDPYYVPEAIYTDKLETIYNEVINDIADSAEEMSEVQIIGHFDYFSRYAPDADSKIRYQHAPQAFDRLFKIMIKNGQALEINVGTIHSLMKRRGYSTNEAMPDHVILNRYRELGGRYFSICSDAHHVERNGLHMAEALAYLKGLGITEFVWFEERELRLP